LQPETPFGQGDAAAVEAAALTAGCKNQQNRVFSGIDGVRRAGDKPAE
jgi:hypothetical protein